MKNKVIIILLISIVLLSVSCVSASDNDTDIMKDSEYLVNGSTTSDIQSAVDSVSSGGVVNLGENKVYTINNDSININKDITIKGSNVSINAGYQSGAFNIRGSALISGINFINTNPLPGYTGNLVGIAVYGQGSSNIVISDCKFINYGSGVYFSSVSSSTIRNCYFNGTTTSVKTAESGTKAINLMGSKNINIINNTFDGQVLDGVSIASGSGDILVENNTFINNTYAIFYGGASTKGSVIKNNRFITCGVIHTSYYSNNLKRTIYIDYDDLPFISLQKSSDNIEITDNTFTVKNSNLVILSEAENTAHGFPSVIGGINITDNTLIKEDSSVDPSTITFYKILAVTSLGLSPVDDININGNDFTDVEGINRFSLEFGAISDDGENITIPKSTAKTITNLNVIYAKDGRVVVELTDSDGYTLMGETITYTINSLASQSQTTDSYGHIYINNLNGEINLKADYAGSDEYAKSSLSSTLQLGNTQTATSITASSLSVYAANAKTSVFKTTLKDASGNTLAGKSVSITFNGKIYTQTSDSNGVVSFKLPTAIAGKYSTTIAFTGDATYKGSVSVATITISKQATKLCVVKKTFKKSATKKVTAVLKDNAGKVIKGKKVTMKVNGKTYSAKTNSKGVATFTVKLTKKGTFKATTKFAGDAYYTLKTVTSKIIVK